MRNIRFNQSPRSGARGSPLRTAAEHDSAFTLIEVMLVTALLTILTISGFAAILSMQKCSSRLADYTAAMAVVEAKIQDVRNGDYNPPKGYFVSYTTNVTANGSIALDQAGTKFLVPGKVVVNIKPVDSTKPSYGHLVTVTGTFSTPSKPIVVSLQTIVNKYCAGQQ